MIKEQGIKPQNRKRINKNECKNCNQLIKSSYIYLEEEINVQKEGKRIYFIHDLSLCCMESFWKKSCFLEVIKNKMFLMNPLFLVFGKTHIDRIAIHVQLVWTNLQRSITGDRDAIAPSSDASSRFQQQKIILISKSS